MNAIAFTNVDNISNKPYVHKVTKQTSLWSLWLWLPNFAYSYTVLEGT